MTYQIEKGIPLPKKSKYPFVDMAPGDSFLIPVTGAGKNTARSTVSGAARWWSRKLNFTFAIHNVPEGIRVWRIK